MTIIDISLPLSDELPTWPGDPGFKRELWESRARGDDANVSRLEMGAHTGTHVDAPVHFVEGGGIEAVPLDQLVGPCLVVEISRAGREIMPEDLPGQPAERLLFKTRNSRHWSGPDSGFDEGFVAVGERLARELVRRAVKLVGVDYLSVEPFDAREGHPVHKILLAAGIAVVEGLNLADVEPGEYQLICLPLRIVGSDGGPARALLVR